MGLIIKTAYPQSCYKDVMRCSVCILIILFAFNCKVTAQDIVIGDPARAVTAGEVVLSGTITEQGTETPLHGATVYVEELERGVSADSAGFYSLTLPPGEYHVRYRYLRMQHVEKQVIIYSSGELDVTMHERELDLDEIIVDAKRYGDNVLDVATGVDVVSISNLEQLPALMGEVNVVQSLKSLTGVGSVGEGSSGFNVRGGKEDQNLILMDGIPVFNSSHVLGLFSVYNPDITESYSLFKGHMPENFGGRLSSVLDVKMKQGSAQEYKAGGGIGLFTGRMMAEGPIIKDKTSFIAAGRISWAEWMLRMNSPGRKHFRLPFSPELANSSANFYDFTTKLSHKINYWNNVSLSAYASRDYFRFSDQFGYAWSNRTTSLSWKSELSDHLFTDVTAGLNYYGSTHFKPSGSDAFRIENGIRYYKLKEHLIYTGFDNHSLNAGVEWNRYISDDEQIEPYSDNSAVPSWRIEKDHGRLLAFYAGDEIEIRSALSLSLGLRYTIYNQSGPGRVFTYQEDTMRSREAITDTTFYSSGEKIKTYRGFEPRLSARYLITPANSVRLSYNKTMQFLFQMSNSTTSTPVDVWQTSTGYIPPQSADNYTIGYYHNFLNDIWESSVEIYYRDIKKLTEFIDFAELLLNDHLETELVSARGRAYGAEVSVNKTSGKWSGRLSYTYARTFVRVNNEQYVNQEGWFPSNYDQPHNVDLIVRRRLGEKSAFSFNFTWQTGRPVTGLVSSYQDGMTTVPVFSKRNEFRVPNYVRLDISFTIAENIWKDRTVDPDRRYKDSMNISFYNILGRKNAFSVFYERPPGSLVPKAQKLSVLGAMIPSVTYNFKF